MADILSLIVRRIAILKYALCDTVEKDFIGENLIISCNHGNMVFMGNTSMGLILQCIQEGMASEQIVDCICETYDVGVMEAEEDLNEVCNKCVEYGIIIEINAESIT